MIKLTINPEKQSYTRIFEKSKVIIGSKSNSEADLSLSEEQLEAIHIIIQEKFGRFFIHNIANDPFVTLNGSPFWKKNLTSHSLLQIGNSIILIDGKPSPQSKQINFLKGEEDSVKKEWIPNPNSQIPKKPQKSQVDYYVVDEFDDENASWHEQPEERPSHESQPKGQRGLIAMVLFALVGVIAIILLGVFFSIKEKNIQEKWKVSEEVADIAMALTYAKINGWTPNRQSLVNPDYLKNHLKNVLATDYQPHISIDSHGHFTSLSYILRISSSPDNTRFFIIAQPAPSLMQWFIPKKSIIIDSQAMELRESDDLRPINRILSDPDAFEGTHLQNLALLVKQEKIIPLALLDKSLKHYQGYSPPNNLAQIHPGAENYIYNAPRYYPFGEKLLAEILPSKKSFETPTDANHSNIGTGTRLLSQFKDLVIYTSEDEEKAKHTLITLMDLYPNHHFLLAHLHFNEHGQISGSHLIQSPLKFLVSTLDIEHLTPTQESDHHPDHNLSDERKISTEEENEHFTDSLKSSSHYLIITDIVELLKNRENTLNPYALEIRNLLESNQKLALPDLEEKFQELWLTYQIQNKESNQLLTQNLWELYLYQNNLSLKEYLDILKEKSLVHLIVDHQNTHSQELASLENLVSPLIGQIHEAKMLSELKKQTEKIRNRLLISSIPPITSYFLLQNKFAYEVRHQLDTFLLAPQSAENLNFQSEDLENLRSIFQNAWITNPEEIKFYTQQLTEILSL